MARLPMADAEVLFDPQFFDPEESDALFQTLTDEIAWAQESITIWREGGSAAALDRVVW